MSENAWKNIFSNHPTSRPNRAARSRCSSVACVAASFISSIEPRSRAVGVIPSVR
jgi:hypothetical protein